jgi:protein-L-isoaspartate O-methyltransferase
MDYKKIQKQILQNKRFLLSEISSKNKKQFFERVWSTSQIVYNKRLKKINFQNCENVLDFGAGFGQWMVQLSYLNKNVYIVEKDSEKLEVLLKIINLLKIKNVKIIKDLIKNKKKFDAIFSYSVIYLTDWKKKVPLLLKSLKKNGLIYINSNDLGWYLYNFCNKHNNKSDFNSKNMAVETFYNSINNLNNKNKYKQLITPKKNLIDLLKKNKVKRIQSGADGTCGTKKISVKKFYLEKFKNVTAVYEVLGKK